MGNLHLPPPQQQIQQEHAIDALIQLIAQYTGTITLVTLGPLTNVAAALIKAPQLAGQVQQCYIMGGNANTIGNITPAAEYNIWCDPEAAQIVFQSGMPILMIGHEHSLGAAVLTHAELAELRTRGELARLAVDCNAAALQASTGWLREVGLTQPDPVAMSIALDPSICTVRERCHVEVETHSELTRGMTVVDRWAVLKQVPNIDVCYEIDAVRWKALLIQLLDG
jgi:purine nucleosidase